MLKIAVIIIIAVMLSACGTKGALYLPTDANSNSEPTPDVENTAVTPSSSQSSNTPSNKPTEHQSL